MPVRHLDRVDAPGLEEYCLDGRHIRLYKPLAVPELRSELVWAKPRATTEKAQSARASRTNTKTNRKAGREKTSTGEET